MQDQQTQSLIGGAPKECWEVFGKEMLELGKDYPVLMETLFDLIEQKALTGRSLPHMADDILVLREKVKNLDKRVAYLEKQNTSLRQKLAWAVRSDDNSQQP